VQAAQHLGVRAGLDPRQVEEGQAVAVADVEEEVRGAGEVSRAAVYACRCSSVISDALSLRV
jgi:hypothetical protein